MIISRIRTTALCAAALALSAAGMFLTVEPAAAASRPADRPPVVAAAADQGQAARVPVHLPVNVCGNSIDEVGGLNPAVGNTCVNA